LQLTPIRDVLSGQEKEVHIVYPKGGFFWDEAKVATTSTMRAQHGDLRLEWPGKYAAAAEVNWTNQWHGSDGHDRTTDPSRSAVHDRGAGGDRA
jgi:hypothetical protein